MLMRNPSSARGSSTAPPDEATLLGRVATEEVEAFEILYRLYHPRLTRFIERLTRRSGMVEEVLDDTMMVVWRKAHTYNHQAKPSTWIFAIAYRQTLKALRHQDEAVEFDQLEHALGVEPGPEAELQQRETRERLVDAMGELSLEHRAVIELTYYLGYACREVAAVMDCPVDTVKTRMFYARRKLKTLLGERREAL